MYCGQCGRQLAQGARFCPYCGQQVAAAPGGAPGTQVPPATPTPPKDPAPGPRRKVLVVVVAALVVAALALAGLALALLFGLGSDGSDASSSDVVTTDDGLVAYYQAIDPDTVVESGDLHYVDGQILVTGVADATYDELEALLAQSGGEVVGYLSITNDYQVDLAGDLTYDELVALCAELEQSELVESASVAYVEEATTDSVDYTADPWIDADDASDTSGSVWSTTTASGKNWWAEAIGMVSVWEMDLDLATVKVGIIDTMFDLCNEDLDEAFATTWYNPTSDDGSCAVCELYAAGTDGSHHGTHVAGIIAAEAENGFGIAGVAQNAELYGFALFSDEYDELGVVSWSSVFSFKYAIALMLGEGVKVINISMGWDEVVEGAAAGDEWALELLQTSSDSLASFLAKYVDAGYEFLICKAAGNDGLEASYDILCAIEDEAVAERIIVVGNAAQGDLYYTAYYTAASDSNYGDRVDVWAPGTDVLSDLPGNVTGLRSGTSMASPVVAGVAALVWGVNPDLTAAQVRQIILASAEVDEDLFEQIVEGVYDLLQLVGEDEPFEALASGSDEVFLVNAYLAVQLAQATEGLASGEELSYASLMGIVYTTDDEGEVEYGTIEDASVVAVASDGTAYLLAGEPVAEGSSFEVPLVGDHEVLLISTQELYSFSALLEPGEYTIEVTVDGYVTQVQDVTLAEGDTVALAFEMTPSTVVESLLVGLAGTYVCEATGGTWAAYLEVSSSGFFTGAYTYVRTDETGIRYPDGTVYLCVFSGQLGDPAQAADGGYVLAVESLEVDVDESGGSPGDSYYLDDVRYVVTDPYGMANASELVAYVAGTSTDDLPDAVAQAIKNRVGTTSGAEATTDEGTLAGAVLYNEADGVVFLTYVEDPEEDEGSDASSTTDSETSSDATGSDSSSGSGSSSGSTAAAEEAYALYEAAVQKLTASGSWYEVLEMQMGVTASYQGQTQSEEAYYLLYSEVQSYDASDPTNSVIVGSGELDVGTYYEFTYTYADGVMTMTYTEPYEATGSQACDPTLYSSTTLSASMMQDVIVTTSSDGSYTVVAFTVAGENLTALGMNAIDSVDLGVDVDDLTYSDVEVVVYIDPDGVLAYVVMNFSASFEVDGVDALATYEITYGFAAA